MDPSSATGKSYWRFSKQDFFPEPTFQFFSTYICALSKTPHRLKDRLIDHSSEANELAKSKKQSENEMKKCLTRWDLIWLGSGIFGITGQETPDHAGPAIVLSYAISGLSALLSVFCYTEFAVEIPIAGGSFSYLRVELGNFMAFNRLREYPLGGCCRRRRFGPCLVLIFLKLGLCTLSMKKTK